MLSGIFRKPTESSGRKYLYPVYVLGGRETTRATHTGDNMFSETIKRGRLTIEGIQYECTFIRTRLHGLRYGVLQLIGKRGKPVRQECFAMECKDGTFYLTGLRQMLI